MDAKCQQFYLGQAKVLRAKGMTNAARSPFGGSRDCDSCECSSSCQDAWDIPDGRGTIVERGDGYIIIASTGFTSPFSGQWAFIAGDTPCIISENEPLTGSLDATQWSVFTDAPYPGGTQHFNPLVPVTAYGAYFEADDNVPFTIKIHFA